MSCGVGGRHSSDLALLWLWCRPAATAPDWTPSLGTSMCCKSSPKKIKKKKQKTKNKGQSLKLSLWSYVFQIFVAQLELIHFNALRINSIVSPLVFSIPLLSLGF